ncbi:hypothetical protein BYT27DRAFT_7249082 [Phlegmacium glaucopus]|nr:hypothetical protein BYT27DRAFT_7249082 [Phlegmacium glaucopus]
MWKQQEEEDKHMEVEMEAAWKEEEEEEKQRVQVERKRVEVERKSREEQQRAWQVEEQRRKEAEVIDLDEEEGEEEHEDNRMESGPSVPKKRKLNEKEQVTLTMEENRLACTQCMGVGTMCHRKMHGPGCWRCYQLKKGCSLVGGKKRMVAVEMLAERVGGKGKAKEVMEIETDGMERLADRLEMIGGWLKKLAETQERISWRWRCR